MASNSNAGERAHARLSPSSAARWLACPGSVNFIEELDAPDQAGDAADEGTILHSFMEDCLLEDIDPFDMIGEVREHNGYSYALTDDDAHSMLDALDRIDEIPGKLYVEKRLDLSRWLPGQFGTSDVGIVGKNRITVWDHKFGYIPVSPVENDQLMTYALGFYDNIARHRTDAEWFRLIIWQPRAPGGGGEWDIHIDDLLDFGNRLKKAGKATYDPDAPRIPGLKQCEGCYCPGAKTLTCAEYADWNMSMLKDDFEELDREALHDLPMRMPRVNSIPIERMVHLAKNKPAITKFLDRVHAHLLDAALKGIPTPGLKAVEGRNPPRKWHDALEVEPDLIRALGEDDAFSRKIISPTQAEKMLPQKSYERISRHIDYGERKPSLVDERDSRPAYRNVADEFNDED